ncbi:hypothetical protein MHK_001410 [Candidatus Magnetomorum sp. HK-1]|nr:hypothetical protein MHK_001410 [Candidatus Magnetomorum sp. HK-1]
MRMKKYIFYPCLILFITTDLFAAFIEVQNAGLNASNGIYVQSGTYNNKARFVNGLFQIRFNYDNLWEIRDSSTLYQNTGQDSIPPKNNWLAINGQSPAPSVLIRPSIHYSTKVFHESESNLGQINNDTPLIIQLDSAEFSGNDGDIFSQSQVFIENMPFGLTPIITRQDSNTLVFQLNGTAINHDNSHDCSNIIVSFQNSAFDNAQASSVINGYISDLSLNFIETIYVSKALTVTTITQALSLADTFDVIFLSGLVFTEQIIVNKSIVINGQSPLMTIVQAAETPETAATSVFKINDNCDVILRNMTIRHGNKDGGIVNRGQLWMEQCAISLNQSEYKGGGINSKGPLLHLSQCTINENLVTGSFVYGGGGIFIDDNTSTILNNCTISGNISDGHGGGILNDGILQIDSCTIVNNRADNSNVNLGNGGGIFSNGSCTLQNTILANNSDQSESKDIFHDFWGEIQSNDYNLIYKTESNTISGDISNTIFGSNPNLKTLAYYGGRLKTHGLNNYGPAINTGKTNLIFDARGVARPCNNSDDIGAFEFCTGSTNTSPEISWIPDLQCTKNSFPLTILFRVADPETSASNLNINKNTDKMDLLSPDNINLYGENENRWLVLWPTENQSGTVSIELNVTDPFGLTACSKFKITILESFHLDIDGDGVVNALSDGLLIVYYLKQSLETYPDLSKIVAKDARRKTLEQITAFLDQGKALLDIDGNGVVQDTTDGILILRYLFEINQGDPFVQGMFTDTSVRNTVESVTDYIDGLY